MANKTILVAFLRAQAKNRLDQAELLKKSVNPNTQMMGRHRQESLFYSQAADIVEKADFARVPTMTSEESDRQRLSPEKVPTPLDATLAPDADPSLSAQPAKKGFTPSGKKIGRPPKMTLKQIEAASSGRAVATNDSDDAPRV